MKKIIAFDLDDTLCYRPPNIEHLGREKYKFCQPIPEMIELSNQLFDAGHVILIYTARGMSTYDGSVEKVYENLYEKTLSDLEKWGIRHNGLVMGKLHYDYLVDDKALDLDSAKENLKKLLNL